MKFGRNPQIFTECQLSANIAHVNIHSVQNSVNATFFSPKNCIMRGVKNLAPISLPCGPSDHSMKCTLLFCFKVGK